MYFGLFYLSRGAERQGDGVLSFLSLIVLESFHLLLFSPNSTTQQPLLGITRNMAKHLLNMAWKYEFFSLSLSFLLGFCFVKFVSLFSLLLFLSSVILLPFFYSFLSFLPFISSFHLLSSSHKHDLTYAGQPQYFPFHLSSFCLFLSSLTFIPSFHLSSLV